MQILAYQVKSESSADTVKVWTVYKTSQERTFSNLEEAIVYADSSLILAKQQEYQKGIIYSGVNLAYLHNIKGEYRTAIEALKQTINSLIDAPDSYNEAVKIYKWLGRNYLRVRQYDSAFFWTNKAILNSKKHHQYRDLATAFVDYGDILLKKNDLKNAVVYYYKADSVCNYHDFKSVSYLSSLSRMGKMNLDSELYTKTLDFLNNYKKRFLDLNNPAGIAEIDFSLGMLEYNLDNYDNALPFFKDYLNYYSRLSAYPKHVIAHKMLGKIYLHRSELSKAKIHLENYARISKEIDDSVNWAHAQNLLGTLSLTQEKYEQAEYYFTNAKEVSKQYNDMVLFYESTHGLANAYLNLNAVKQAGREFLEASKIQDSVLILKNNERVLSLFTETKINENENEIQLLKSQNQLIEQQKNNQRNLLVGGLLLTTFIGMFFFFLYRNRQRTNRKLQELDTFKSQFFTNISHEFRTPLTLITTPIEKRLETNQIDNEERSDLLMMQRNSKRLLNLVDQLLDLSKIESGELSLNVQKGNISLFLKMLTSSFLYLAEQKNIRYFVDIQNDQSIWFDKDVVEKTVVNLLSNAFKYTSENGIVNFKAYIKNERLYMVIRNEGIPVSELEIDKIFNRFYQANSNVEGVGIGLSLVKELVTLSHGTISVENSSLNTISFSVILPSMEHQFAADEFGKKEMYLDQFNFDGEDYLSSQESTFSNNKDELPLMLIVEDNQDVSTFIRRSLLDDYKIIEANNGEEGIKKAIETIPDIIISDVMMPKTDGFQLCNVLKHDERTSHIPIILLTARVEERDQFKGLEIKADEYITKPFKLKILKQKSKNLVESRKQLRKRYSEEMAISPKNLSLTKTDQIFFEKIKDVLEAQLTNTSFNTEAFSLAVGMSRMQLYRKLKALTGLSATEFIRSQRLKLAVSLLEKSDVNISEIGYAVGFNDPSYFTKCFKEQFNSTPSEYLVKNKR